MSGELEQIVSVRVLTTPEAGEPVGALLESIFGTTASVWSEDGSSEAKVTVYLERESVGPAEEASLGQGLDVLRAAGLDVSEGEWAVERVKREDWSESWKKHFSPIEVSDRLLVKPEWEEIEPKLGQAVVILNPGMSFGTGHHATTLFCFRQLRNAFRSAAGRVCSMRARGRGFWPSRRPSWGMTRWRRGTLTRWRWTWPGETRNKTGLAKCWRLRSEI